MRRCDHCGEDFAGDGVSHLLGCEAFRLGLLERRRSLRREELRARLAGAPREYLAGLEVDRLLVEAWLQAPARGEPPPPPERD